MHFLVYHREKEHTKDMGLLTIIFLVVIALSNTFAYPITYDQVRGSPYKVSYDHRAVTINGNRTLLSAGVVHYPRSTPAMWPYIMSMAKKNGLNTIQTYVFWNIHEIKKGTYDFSGRANLSLFLQEAANAGLFVNLRLGPYVCAEWDYGGLPVWLNNVPGIEFRSSNNAWETEMKRFIGDILDYVTPYLAKNGGPIILAQIENEYSGGDSKYVDWCGSLVSNDFAWTEVVWIMCNGAVANSTIGTCNGFNCYDNGWMEKHRQAHPDQPLMWTENWGWFQAWGEGPYHRSPEDLSYSVAEWFANGGGYQAYYMWHGGNQYGRTTGSGLVTAYSDTTQLHSDGTPFEPKYTHTGRLHQLLADHAQVLVSQDSVRVPVPYWDGSKWANGTQQCVYSYPPSLHFILNQAGSNLFILFNNQNISIARSSVQIYDYNVNLLWNSANTSGILTNNTDYVTVVQGPLDWKYFTEPLITNLPTVTSSHPLEQLNLTNDETVYLWYRRNISLTQPSAQSVLLVDTRRANSLLFFLDGQYLGSFTNRDHAHSTITANVTLNLGQFQPSQQYRFDILSVCLGNDNFNIGYSNFEYKGIVGKVVIDGQVLTNGDWKHQKGLYGENSQIFTEQGSKTVEWNPQWTSAINKSTTWFQTHFDLDKLARQDLNANPVLINALGLNRGHVYVNGYDLGMYWLILSDCKQDENGCGPPSQQYYHMPPDWLMPKNNLLTVFEELGASSPASVSIVQRVTYS